jgi:ABC-type multidrug transport system ATPase subunit
MDDHLLLQVVAIGLQADDRTLLSDEFVVASRSVYMNGAMTGTGMNNGAAVEADALVKRYEGKNGGVEAVRGVDLRVESGEVFGFLGPNGAGKSTTVKMLTTLLSITSGTARVAGVDIAEDPDEVRRRIGVALQEAGLDPRQTGRELLVLQARAYSPSWSSRRRRTAASRAIRAG